MKHFLLLALLALTLPATAQQLAFPGADGYGRYTTGGRGGDVFYVTRLDDCTDAALVPGTLRWALNTPNGGKPRTVLFNVAGTIYLSGTKLKVKDNTSLLGQTAPGGGVCVAGKPMYICGKNIIVRHIRFRAGDVENQSYTGLDMENAQDVILDHCSMTWSMEECLTAYDTKRTTVQWCIIGEGLYNSKNAKGARAYAAQWGGERSTMHHTLITNSHSRSPRFNGVRKAEAGHDFQVDSEYANNVVFNWSQGNGGAYGGECVKWSNNGQESHNRVYAINNYYRPGPSTKLNTTSQRYWLAPSQPYGEWYVSGNKFEVDGQFSPKSGPWAKAELESVNADNLYGTTSGTASSRGINLTGAAAETYIMKQLPYDLSGLQYESADDAYRKVVRQAGASLPRYDEVDSRLLAEARGEQAPQFAGPTLPAEKGIIDSPDNVVLSRPGTYMAYGTVYHNYPDLSLHEGEKYAIDTDLDGMPDAYETSCGLNPNDATDGATVCPDGYTNLEHYLNGVADGTIRKQDYETSATPAAPASVTVTIGTQTLSGNPVTLPTTVSGNTYAGYMGGGQWYEAGGAYTFTTDMTLTPVVTVAFSDTDIATLSVAAATEITLPTAERDGYTFEGWQTDGQTYQAGETLVATTCLTLTPVFTKVSGPSGSGTATVTWPLDGSLDTPATQEPAGLFTTVTATAGTALTVSAKSIEKKSFLAVQPTEQIAAPDAANTLSFTIVTADGLKFRPTHIDLYAAKFGTNGGKLDITLRQGSAADLPIATAADLRRDKVDGVYSTLADCAQGYDIAGASLTDGPQTVSLALYSLGNTKQAGFRNIVVTGEWEGAASGITAPQATTAAPNAPTYNALGQRVAPMTRGLVIQRGRKRVNR